MIGNKRAADGGPKTDREDVARLISKYNLLMIRGRRRWARDGSSRLTMSSARSFASRPNMRVRRYGSARRTVHGHLVLGLIKKRGDGCAPSLRDADATAMQRFEGEIAKAVVLAMFIP